MNRPNPAFAFMACALFAFASAALCAQQPSQSSTPYSGTSNPPPDDTIESSEPQQPQPQPKPPAGKPMNAQPAAPSAPQTPDARNTPASPADTTAGTDAGTVQIEPPAPAASSPGKPGLSHRYADDPDGDIVHPAPLPPGVIGEGTTIRVHLMDRLSTVDSASGDAFRSTVASDVVENGQVLIPAGAEIDGHVIDVSSGHAGSHGFMRLRPETVILADGTRYRLSAYVAGAPGSHARIDREGTIGAESRIKRDSIEYGGAVGAGAITGAVMAGPAGALAGTLIGAGAVTLHLMVSHPQATLEPGTVLLFTLSQPLNLVATSTTASNATTRNATN